MRAPPFHCPSACVKNSQSQVLLQDQDPFQEDMPRDRGPEEAAAFPWVLQEVP